MKVNSVKKKVEPYKKNNTYRYTKKAAIATAIFLPLAGLLYKILKINKNDKTDKTEIKKQTKK
jgi:hypothetical protein